MQDANRRDEEFLKSLNTIIQENISDEQFGVSELAARIGMSRSNLLRRVSKLTNLSVSQFIRQVRLNQAMQMLREGSLNVSEVTFRVGFSSPSYFIKCFREQYGYPPGEVSKHPVEATDPPDMEEPERAGRKRGYFLPATAGLLALICVILFILLKPFRGNRVSQEKSIAVLPFVNDSNDSTNIYLINGIMESLLVNLQQIEDMRVISRTSVEKYRTTQRTIPEIAGELNVRYLVEGSGQKIGDQVLLYIQLVDAASDKQLWAEQYKREATDIFNLQMEVSKSIAGAIKAIITPEEEERISMVPTDNPVAYDYYLQGLDLYNKGTGSGLEESIPLFEKAIAQDPSFANPYAYVSIAYSFLEWGRSDKEYAELANSYADKALMHNPKLAQSLIAKALYYMGKEAYEDALPHLETALKYNPNSAVIINILSDFYARFAPDSEKYLEYALKGIRLDIAAHDSTDASFIFLHVSNALFQFGFVEEALQYVNRSLSYNPENLYARTLKAYVLFARDGDLEQTKELLIEAMPADTSIIDMVLEVGKICYFLRDHECAGNYYDQFLILKESLKITDYQGEDAKIAYVFDRLGRSDEAKELYRDYKAYADQDNSIYRHLSLAVYYANHDSLELAMEHLDLFLEEEYHPYLIIPLLEIDPLLDPLKEMDGFQEFIREIKVRFWSSHNRVRETLESEGLL